MIDFGKFIKAKRIQLGLTQQNLADVCCCHSHRSDICKLEADKIEWKLRDIMAISELFNLPVSQLLEEYENTK